MLICLAESAKTAQHGPRGSGQTGDPAHGGAGQHQQGQRPVRDNRPRGAAGWDETEHGRRHRIQEKGEIKKYLE